MTAARWLAASTLLDTTTCVLPNVDTPVSMNLGHGVVWVPQIVTRIRTKLKRCVSSLMNQIDIVSEHHLLLRCVLRTASSFVLRWSSERTSVRHTWSVIVVCPLYVVSRSKLLIRYLGHNEHFLLPACGCCALDFSAPCCATRQR